MNSRYLFILFLVAFLNIGTVHQPKAVFTQHVFALGIIANPTGNDPIVSFAIISFQNGQIVSTQPITKSTFIRMACGDWPSKANPNREDLFIKHEVELCGRYIDTLTKEKLYLCDLLDSLWKVRFSEHPYIFDDSGWSRGKYKPNAAQLKFLYENYEVSRINLDYFIGNFMWKLLKDIQDPEWINHYKSLEDI